jgi:hypothetical protein
VNEEDMEAVEPLAGEELERMLARYARVRLEPSQAQARRARAAVMEEAWRRRLDPQSILRASPPSIAAARPSSTRRVPFTGWGPRRLGVAFTAATLAGLLLGSSVFAASRAGGPLYESRLALEALTLPADPTARVAAQLEHADARLGEAVEAGFRHDDRAVAAALDAYDRTLEDLSTASGAPADQALAAIQLHRSVLLQLATQVPSAAAAGIDTALESSDKAIVKLGSSGPSGSHPGNSGGGGSSGTFGNPQGNGFGANGGGNAAGGQGIGQDGDNAGGNGNGNANGAGNGSGVNPADSPEPTAAATASPTASPTDRPAARPTPRPTPVPTPKPNTGPQNGQNPGKTPKPHPSTPENQGSRDQSPSASEDNQP